MATAPQILSKTAAETRNVAVSFANMLDSGESLTGTPTILEITTTALTLSDKVVSSAALTIAGVSVPSGSAVTFKVVGGVAGTTYRIGITCGTNATPAQTLRGVLVLKIEGNN